jgi:hypothetical protein
MPHPDNRPQPVRMLTARRGGALLALPMAACGRATPVAVSARLPTTALWLVGLAYDQSLSDRSPWWLLDALPSQTDNADTTTVALLAAGHQPAWGLLIDSLDVLTLAVAGGGAPTPLAVPAAWYSGCLLADGRRAALLDPSTMLRDLQHRDPRLSAA